MESEPPADCTTTRASPRARAVSGRESSTAWTRSSGTWRCCRKRTPCRSSTWPPPTRNRAKRHATQLTSATSPRKTTRRARARSGWATACSRGPVSPSSNGTSPGPGHDLAEARRSRATRSNSWEAAYPRRAMRTTPPRSRGESGWSRCHSPGRGAARSVTGRPAGPRPGRRAGCAGPPPRRRAGPGSEPPLSGEAVWISQEAMPKARARGPDWMSTYWSRPYGTLTRERNRRPLRMTISSSSSTHEIALTWRMTSHAAHSPPSTTASAPEQGPPGHEQADETGHEEQHEHDRPGVMSRTRASIGETGCHGRSPPRRVTSAVRARGHGCGVGHDPSLPQARKSPTSRLNSSACSIWVQWLRERRHPGAGAVDEDHDRTGAGPVVVRRDAVDVDGQADLRVGAHGRAVCRERAAAPAAFRSPQRR